MAGHQPSRLGTFARRLLLSAFDREEQGFPPMNGPGMPPHSMMADGQAQHPDPMGPGGPGPGDFPPKRLTLSTTEAGSLIPSYDKLLIFRALTGIDSVPALTALNQFARSAPNVGIYTRVVRAEQASAQRYRLFSILINTCLSIQIVVAAALTAIGAASGPHSAVTAFGAINTIMAGVLTYLKGSGLPDRLKHYQNEWRNIREYIEQRERELCLDGCALDIQEEIQIIEHMYEGVKRELEATKSGGENRAAQQPGHRRSFLPGRPYPPPQSSSSPYPMPPHPQSHPQQQMQPPMMQTEGQGHGQTRPPMSPYPMQPHPHPHPQPPMQMHTQMQGHEQNRPPMSMPPMREPSGASSVTMPEPTFSLEKH
ncbi:uncharacterized protein LDX57_007479 [Aspergillus melleus]|uniref:uncharacterized protein n=1 Tax=Aspergillus melleus TaxID=138277 RepID=UPI001E8DE459|nr:uncharacterized protein LDX57_007479 [Aspergillus melleus]KAH8429808.1 hypothetical protein LDX57_007479 [Aspergillus melleus]